MIVAIVLGNRLNDDGTITSIMKRRLDLAREFYNTFKPEYMICSGGLANPLAGRTEAQVMKMMLVDAGIPEEALIEEGSSMCTADNAKFSMAIIQAMLIKGKPVKTIAIISSSEHFTTKSYNILKYFTAITADKSYRFLVYTDGEGEKHEN